MSTNVFSIDVRILQTGHKPWWANEKGEYCRLDKYVSRGGVAYSSALP